MTDRIRKFRNDTLTPSELEQLRDALAETTDDELATEMAEDWDRAAGDGSLDAVRVGTATEVSVKRRIDSRIAASARTSTGVRVWRIASAVAAVLLPLFVVATVVLYNELSRHVGAPDESLSFVTFKNQHSELFLPDSTAVTLNGNSVLTYSRHDYTGDTRTVTFDGEAYFDVSPDAAHPFVITAPGLSVTVKGTRFNLLARQGLPYARLYLEEGSVAMRSQLTGQSVMLHPGECATLTYSDGNIAVAPATDAATMLAWLSGGIVFTDCPFADVITTLEHHYGCNLAATPAPADACRFTGTLPHDDLSVAISILDKIFTTTITCR